MEMETEDQSNAAKLDIEISPELEEALRRVTTSETLKYSQLLKNIINLNKRQTSLKASNLLAKREIIEAAKFNEGNESLMGEENIKELKIKEKEKKDQVYKAFLNESSLSNVIQTAVFQTQIQNNFYESLKENDAESDPLIKSILINYNDNIEDSSKLINILEKKDQLEKDILDLRLEYRSILHSIESKWKVITLQEPPIHKYKDNIEVKQAEEKLGRREARLSMLVGLLQNIITGSGEAWGSNPRLLQILLLCDSASSMEDSLIVRDSVQELVKTRPENKRTGGLDTYITSTPR